MVSESNIAYTFYVLKNNFAVWEKVWKYHADNTCTCQEDKVKFNMYKRMTEREFEDEGLNNDDKNKFTVVKGFYTGGIKKEPMSYAVIKKGKKYYRRTERAIRDFFLTIKQGMRWVGSGQLKTSMKN